MFKKGKFREVIKKRPVISAFAAVLLFLGAAGAISLLTGKDAESSIQKYTVKQGPLRISITETGTIQPKDKIIVKNKVEGSTAITYIVDEGSTVKKGDLMVQLDSSSLTDKQIDQEIQVQKAEASRIEANENYEVTKNQAQSNIESAQLTYDFAQLDLEKYIAGEYPDKLKEAESNITVAKEELAQAEDTLDWSKKLYEEGYLSQSELEKDTLSHTRKQLSVELKTEARELLVNYTYKRQLAKLESDVTQAKAALERTIRKSKASIAQAEAKKAAMQAEYERQVAKLEKYKTQLESTRIYAPSDGAIIYATSAEQSSHGHSHNEPLKVGNSVRERQELIHLPSTSGFIVNLSIPEGSIGKVKAGLPAHITVDTLPNVVYKGTVTSVANVVNAEEVYMNTDSKVYDTVITLENGGDMELLHSGMTCKAEIIIDQYESAVYVPIQAVMTVAGKPTVFVVRGEKVKPRVVETGLDNNVVIRIAGGLEPGEIVSLSPPLEKAAVVESTYKELSDILSSSAGAPGSGGADVVLDKSPASAVNGRDSGSSTEAGKDDSAKQESKDPENRYSTTGSISDSGDSGGGMPGGGGMGGGGPGF